MNTMINLPEEYRTGNPGMDKKIAAQLEKERIIRRHNNKMLNLFHSQQNNKPTTNKYNVVAIEDRTYVDGTIFATKGEMIRWDYLLKIQKVGEIKDLQMQVPFELQESFISKQHGNVQSIVYVADFVYFNICFRKEFENRLTVEDCKGAKKNLTQSYLIKKKLFLRNYGTYLFFEVYPD